MATAGLPHPSKYDGTEPFMDWLETFTLYSTAMEWNEAAQVARLPLFLEKQAYQAYRQLAPAEKDTMNNLSAAMGKATEKVAPMVLKQTQALKLERTQNESWDSYSFRLKNALKLAYPEASNATIAKMVSTRVFETFPKEVKTQILLRDISSLPEMLNAAKLMESFTEWNTNRVK